MDKQTQHKIFAEQITADYIEKITGEGVDRVVGKIPEDQFIVGQLAPYSPDAASFITSRVVINGIGLTFNISCEALNIAIIKTQLCGNWFYRVLPSYEEQCKETIRQYNKLFDKEYTSITEFINDEEVQSTLATTDNKKSNSYDIRLLQIYKKVSLEDLGLYVTVKLSDVYDQENNLAYVDDLHSSNLQIYEKIQQVIKERVLTDPQYYAYDIRSKMTLQDLKDVDSWNKFFSTEVKEAKNLPNWNVAIILEAKK